MPKIVRVKIYFVFCDIKTFVRSDDCFLGELRRFNLSVYDNEDESSSALYDQLVQKIQTTFGTDLMPKGQPFRLYWKDKDNQYIGFYTSSELLEAIDVMKPSKLDDALSKLKYHPDSLKIFVCVPDNVAKKTTNECGRVTQAPPRRAPPTIPLLPTSSSAATRTLTTTATSPSQTTTATAPLKPATQSDNVAVKIETSQQLITVAAAPAAAFDESSLSDEYDVVN